MLEQQIKTLYLIKKNIFPGYKDIRDIIIINLISQYTELYRGFLYAVKIGRLDWIKYLLKNSVDLINKNINKYLADDFINSYMELGQSIVSSCRNIETLKYLLSENIDLSLTDTLTDTWTSVHCIRLGKLDILKFLIEQGNSISCDRICIESCRCGHLDILQFVLSGNIGKPYDKTNKDMIRLKKTAIKSERTHIILYLLETGETIVTIDDLVYSFLKGRINMLKLLMDNIVKEEKLECYNYMFVYSAARGNLEMVKYFLERGVDVNIYQCSALSRASENGHLSVARCLMEQNIDIICQKKYILDLLETSCESGDLDMINFLVERGAMDEYNSIGGYRKYKKKYRCDFSPYCLVCSAVENGHIKVMEYLIGKGFDLYGHESDLLISAVKNGCQNMFLYLLKQGMELKKNGIKILQTAIMNNSTKIIMALSKIWI